MSRSNKVIAITMGDPRGIGPEIIRKSLSVIKRPFQFFVVIGSRRLLGRLPVFASVLDVPYCDPGEGALKFLDRAIALIKDGVVDGLVTAPLAKDAVSHYHKGFVGHTEYLAEAFGVKKFDMMFIAPGMRLSIVTRHVPLKDVPSLITKKTVFASIALMDETLTIRFHVRHPRIAVLGLNPHAGEAGLLGKEEARSIVPAIQKAKTKGIKVDGPFPADTFFAYGNLFDGIIAMYHDQGLAPVKGMHMKELVNFTAGLPFMRTSPAHGTAFDIVGKNKADPSSMTAAIHLACQLC